ncbi:hypothetical protein [Sorangium sp. So ce1153]|uniref:hypothetical protein n=1 Tax=Sorangium sp. So ce1153 TaxID=3133333 RepID=UPI003F60D9B6
MPPAVAMPADEPCASERDITRIMSCPGATMTRSEVSKNRMIWVFDVAPALLVALSGILPSLAARNAEKYQYNRSAQKHVFVVQDSSALEGLSAARLGTWNCLPCNA